MKSHKNTLAHEENAALDLVNELEGQELEMEVLVEELKILEQVLQPSVPYQPVEKISEGVHLRLARAIVDQPLPKLSGVEVTPLSLPQRKKLMRTIEEQREKITDLLVEMSNNFMAMTDSALSAEILGNPTLKKRLKQSYLVFRNNLGLANRRITLLEINDLID